MIRLTSSEVYNSIFNKTEQNNILELYTDTFHKFSSAKVKDELEEILSISDITLCHLKHEKRGPPIFEAYM